MPKVYNEDHLIDEFGRMIPYDKMLGAFQSGTPNDIKRRALKGSDPYVNDGAYVEGSKIKQYLDDTYNFYGETSKKGEGRKLYVGDIHASFDKEANVGKISTTVINNRNDIKEKPRFIIADINAKEYNEYMSSSDADRLKFASDHLDEIRIESTKKRITEIGNISIHNENNGNFTITSKVDGEKITRRIDTEQFKQLSSCEDNKKEKYFAKIFDCKGVKPIPGDKNNVGTMISNAIKQQEICANITKTLSQNNTEKESLPKNTNKDSSQTNSVTKTAKVNNGDGLTAKLEESTKLAYEMAVEKQTIESDRQTLHR